MSKLESLTITGYKSIRELRDFPLENLNVLIGANGAGKSNFISLFRFLNNIYEGRLQIYLQEQGGPDALLYFGRRVSDRLHAEFYFGQNAYTFDLIPTQDNRLIFENESSHFLFPYTPEDFEFGKDELPAGAIPIPSPPSTDLDESTRLPKISIASSPNIPRILGTGHEESKLKAAPYKDIFSSYAKKAINSWRVYHFHDTSETAKVKQLHPNNDNLYLKSDAANLAPYLRRLYKNYSSEYQRIVKTIQLVAPFFEDFLQRSAESDFIELEWVQKDNPGTPFKTHMLSDGTLRFICLITLLLQPAELLPDLILIDEPELGLHPYAITILASVLKQVSEERQLIISTQSVELVNELEPKDVIVVDQRNGSSTFERLSEEKLSDWLEEYSLGELWKRNILGGRP